ncbi:MAG: succinyl-diaminopimelate desuccinylase [Pseudomonadota bacterium]
MSAPDATVEFARTLLRCPSVTPDDAGCQALIAARLAACGFRVASMPFGDVDNLFAVRGRSGPMLCFAGHTDVVPTGPEADWTHPPFAGVIEHGVLHGRGAVDMKGAVAAMVTACERFTARLPDHPGRLAFLITSDEEGPAIDGTQRVVATLRTRDVTPDFCLIGEPSSDTELGDRVRHGRRGSLNGTLHIEGQQGHVAYPQLAHNPIHDAVGLLDSLARTQWDDGDGDFPPTSFQVSNIAAGTGANNVIPGTLEARFNFRFSNALSSDQIIERVEQEIAQRDLPAKVHWHRSGEPFLSPAGRLREATRASIKAVTGRNGRLSTSGGTSDGRFICGWAGEVIEFGLVGQTIHQTNERVAVADLIALSRTYEDLIGRLLLA